VRWCEVGLVGCAALLLVNALLPHPALWPLYAISAVMMAVSALQQPSFDASVPRLIPRDQQTAALTLLSLSQNVSFLLGSALGGVIAVTPGPWLVYALNAASLAVSFGFLTSLRPLPRAAEYAGADEETASTGSPLRDITTGLRSVSVYRG
jgi:MFS family permease